MIHHAVGDVSTDRDANGSVAQLRISVPTLLAPLRGIAVRRDARGAVPNRGAVTLSIMLANIMQGLDTTIANVALPHIRGSLSASLDQISWVLTSYIVAAAITMPLTGWLAGRFGIKQVFILSVGGFTAARRCAAAPPHSPNW